MKSSSPPSTSRWGSIAAPVVTLTVVGSAVAFWIIYLGNRKKPDAPKPIVPAVQTIAVKEGELNVITLTEEAEGRLGLQTAKVVTRKVDRVRTLGGEVVLPPGRAVVVSAPFAGTVKAAGGGGGGGGVGIVPGRPIKRDAEVFTLMPLLTNEARTTLATTLVEAEGLVKNADVQLKAATIALARAKQLAAEEAGSKRAVDEAQAAHDLAQKTLEAAQARRDVLKQTLSGADAGSVPSLSVRSPADGIVRNVMVAAGQPVSAGAPLFEVANQDVLWVRVPVYVGDLGEMAADQPATIGRLGDRAREKSVVVKPVAAPASATAANASKDLYYEADNSQGTLAPGERVSVAIPGRAEEESPVVPWSAIVYDINGGAWVYELVGPRKYVRQRVGVRNVIDAGTAAVLAGGPKVGATIVTQGVAELFGREMGFAK